MDAPLFFDFSKYTNKYMIMTNQVKVEALGRLYASLGKRHGKVVDEEMVEGSSTFSVTAHLPVVESFQFAQEIRRQGGNSIA